MRKACLKLGIEWVIAGYEPGGARSCAKFLNRGNRCSLDRRVLGQVKVVIARERQKLTPVSFDPDTVFPQRLAQRPVQPPPLEIVEFVLREAIKRVHQ